MTDRGDIPEVRAAVGLFRNRWLVFFAAAVGAVAVAASVGAVGVAAVTVAAAVSTVWALTHPRSFGWIVGIQHHDDNGEPTLRLAELGPGPLLAPARPLPPPAAVLPPHGLRTVPVGQILDDFNQPTGGQWTLSPWGSHTLVAGITGAGKSGVFWALMHGLGPYVQCGSVVLHGIDPKMGVELGAGRELFKRIAHGREWWVDAADMVKDLSDKMFKRGLDEMYPNRIRFHIPTPAAPLHILIIDELASITRLEAKRRTPITDPLHDIMEKGRAAGFSVVGAVQDPRAETIPFRPLFSTFVMLHLPSTIIDPICGPGSRELGMRCDQISPSQPGTAFVMDETMTPMKVKAYWHDDADVLSMAHRYGRVS